MHHWITTSLTAATVAGVLGSGASAFAAEPELDPVPDMGALLQRIGTLEHALAGVLAAQKAGAEPAPAPTAAPAASPNTLGGKWSHGLRLVNDDKSIEIKFGGRVQADGNWFQEDRDIRTLGLGRQLDGVEFRRARLYFQGTIAEHYIFKAQYDFATRATAAGTTPGSTTTFGSPGFKDAYIGVQKLGAIDPVIHMIRVGHCYEPFGLEEQTSSKYLTFMERSAIAAFNPSRNFGIRLDGTADDVGGSVDITWATGVYRETDDTAAMAADGSYAWTTRVTGRLPIGGDDRLVHLGLDFSLRSPPGHARRYRDARELHLASRATSTGTIAARGEMLVGLEVAVVWGPFSFQSEMFRTVLEQPSGTGLDDFDFWGAYAYVSFFITGESRPYKGGVFDRVKPKSEFLSGEGWGALEVALRYTHLDTADQTARGGRLHNWTLGLNWYLSANVRVMLNYLYEDVRNGLAAGTRSGRIHGLGTRVAIDF